MPFNAGSFKLKPGLNSLGKSRMKTIEKIKEHLGLLRHRLFVSARKILSSPKHEQKFKLAVNPHR